ncbi:MAG: gliding motility-associated C-terminal domain-containing protein, partial [Flavobacteriaceae bacterium]|nr:gliding motility-associated C-terminal domain-containing protein [Flavobacteriaceae bacterium]
NETVECDAIPDMVVLTAIDNCDASIEVQTSEVISESNSYAYIITRTWTATDSCENSITHIQTINVLIVESPTVDIENITQPTCVITTGSFTITNYNSDYIYSFTPEIISNTNGVILADTGTYTITASQGECSSDASETIIINKPSIPEVIDLSSQFLCIYDIGENEDGSFDLSKLIPNYDDTGTWEDTDYSEGLDDNIFTPHDVLLGDYIITYTELGDCGKIYQITINVNDDCDVLGCTAGDIKISKVVTPNGDGHNDYFEVGGYNEDCGFILKVKLFNRWGKRIYVSENYKNNWNGHHDNTGMTVGSNSLLPSGTYYYTLNVVNGDMKTITGYIYLGTN